MQKTPFSSHVLVSSQAIGMAMAIWPSGVYWLPGLLVFLSGIILGIWVIYFNKPGNFSIYPEPVNHAELIISGPYKYLRHPMYSALLLIIFGITSINGNIVNIMGAVMIFTVVLFKMPREERYLTNKYDNYKNYCLKTKRIIPGIW